MIVAVIIVLVVVLTKKKKDNKDKNETQYKKFVVKGTFIDTKTKDDFRIREGYILVEDGIIKNDISVENPDTSLKLYDYTNKLIIPGLSDLHLHAPQYVNAP